MLTMADSSPKFYANYPNVSQNDNNYDECTSESVTLAFGGHLVSVPKILIENDSILHDVLKKSTFNVISVAAQEHLKKYLPLDAPGLQNELEEVLECAFTEDKNFYFGNPISRFCKKARNGQLSIPQGAHYTQLRDIKRVLYDHFIRSYNMRLLKKLLINRHKLLEKASRTAFEEKVLPELKNSHSKRKLKKRSGLSKRAKLRARRIIKYCKTQAGDEYLSSDDSELDYNEDDITMSANPRSTLFSKKFSAPDIGLYQPTQNKSVKEMLSEYKRLRETEPDCPSLDIADISFDDICQRLPLQQHPISTNLYKMHNKK